MTVNAVNTYIVPTAANEVTMPSQPGFLAYLSTGDDNDVTGNNTPYQLGTNIAFTEVFDQNADLTLNPVVFTAPVTGKYFLALSVNVKGTAANTDNFPFITTSNRTYYSYTMNSNTATEISAYITCLADMDAADTAIFTIQSSGVGADTADIDSGSPLVTYMSGYLAT